MSIMIREYERVFYTRGHARDLFGGVRKSWERNQGGGKEAQKFSIQSVLSLEYVRTASNSICKLARCVWAQVPHRRFFPPTSYDSYSISTTSSSYSS